MMGLCSLDHGEKKTIRQSSKIMDNQRANGIVVSDTQAKVHIKELGTYLRCTFGERFSVSAIVLKSMQWPWLFLFVAVRRNFQIIKR